jgi:hypothetical protein
MVTAHDTTSACTYVVHSEIALCRLPPSTPGAAAPPRLLGPNSFMGQTKLCKPGSHAYDEKVAKDLWEESAARAGVPAPAQA